jgi:orotidine-5'-phosphate decarboxylase
MTSTDPRVIVALDFANPMHALALADRLDPAACALKVGKEMFVVAGPEPVRWMIERGFRVFLDLKFHDIPNTVAQACAAATRLGVWMLNVHAAGGRAMLEAARDAVARTAADAGRPRPLLIAVTVLTSLSDADLRDTGVDRAAADQALKLAQLTAASGLDGVVSSAVEAPALRAALGPGFKLVTPGIRPAGSSKDDQARIITPEAAVANGADYLVIGRPITQAPDPLAALSVINAALGVRR